MLWGGGWLPQVHANLHDNIYPTLYATGVPGNLHIERLKTYSHRRIKSSLYSVQGVLHVVVNLITMSAGVQEQGRHDRAATAAECTEYT